MHLCDLIACIKVSVSYKLCSPEAICSLLSVIVVLSVFVEVLS